MAHQYIYTMVNLRKVVPPQREILKGIYLSFFPGAKIGVLGLNGAGKSTVLKIMAGVERDFAGRHSVPWSTRFRSPLGRVDDARARSEPATGRHVRPHPENVSPHLPVQDRPPAREQGEHDPVPVPLPVNPGRVERVGRPIQRPPGRHVAPVAPHVGMSRGDQVPLRQRASAGAVEQRDEWTWRRSWAGEAACRSSFPASAGFRYHRCRRSATCSTSRRIC